MGLPLVQVLMCLLLLWSCATYPQFPANSTTCLGAATEFDCASTDAQTIFYYVNNTPAVSLSAQGITVSAPISNGSITHVKLYVARTFAASVSQILCTILFTNGSFLNSTSYLTTQGPPSAVANLAANPFNATSIRLAWTPPANAQILSTITYTYIVEVRNGSGALLYNVTVTVPQFDIAIPDPCDQYQATVTTVCGTTSGANNISLPFLGAPPSAPSNFTSTALNATSTRLTWMPPNGFQYSSLLLYGVEVRNVEGTLVFNETVSMPQVVLTTLSSCGQYQVAIAAKCKTGANITLNNLLLEKSCNQSGTGIPASTTMFREILGGCFGGVAFIAIILIIIIISYILQRKRGRAEKRTCMVDQTNGDEHEVSVALSSLQHTYTGVSLPTLLEQKYMDIEFLAQGNSAIVIKAKKKDSKDEDYYAIKITPVDNRIEIQALLKLKQEAGTVRYIDDWDELAPSDWQARSPWNKFPERSLDIYITQGKKLSYIVMDFCDGGNLESWLPDHIQRFSVHVIFDKILTSLEAIHSHGVYHQDLSLQNIFVALGNKFQIKIGGFNKPILAKSDVVLKKDILSLGYVLMQLIYCKKNSGKLPKTQPCKFDLILSRQSDKNPIQMLFNMLQANGACSPEEISVIELLCGKNLCGDGISDLVVLHQSGEYKSWKEQKKCK